MSKPSWSRGRVGVRMRKGGQAEESDPAERRFCRRRAAIRSGPLGSQKADESDGGRGPGGGWPVGVRRLVSAVLIFHISAILVGALSSPPSSLLERSLADVFAPYFQVIDQGYAYRYYAPEPPPTPVVTATVHFADGRPDETVRLPRKDAFPWLLRQRQLALANHLLHGLPGGRDRGGRREPEPLGTLLRPAPGADAPRLFVDRAHQPASFDSRGREGSRAARKAGLEAGGSRRRGVLHHARADRGVRAVRRLLNDLAAYLALLWRTTARAWNGFFFTPADPTALGLIRVLVGLLLFWNLAVYGLDLHGFLGTHGWADPAIVRLFQGERAPYAWSFWLLVPDGLLRPAWVVCMVVLALYTLGLFSRVDGGARLGDRGLDRAAFAGDALRLRPDRLDPGALPGRHGGERAGGLARPLPGPRPPGARADRAAARRRPLDRAAGGARGDGLGQPGAAADPAPPRPDLRHGGPGEASGAGVVVGYGHLGDAGVGRVQPARLYLDGRLAVRPERLDPRRPGARAGAMAS